VPARDPLAERAAPSEDGTAARRVDDVYAFTDGGVRFTPILQRAVLEELLADPDCGPTVIELARLIVAEDAE
jgi:hypothetical protein